MNQIVFRLVISGLECFTLAAVKDNASFSGARDFIVVCGVVPSVHNQSVFTYVFNQAVADYTAVSVYADRISSRAFYRKSVKSQIRSAFGFYNIICRERKVNSGFFRETLGRIKIYYSSVAVKIPFSGLCQFFKNIEKVIRSSFFRAVNADKFRGNREIVVVNLSDRT